MRTFLPAMQQEPFGREFMAVLHSVLAARGELASQRDSKLRAQRRQLSHSGSFVGHRRYVRLDDPRTIDWAVYARSGEWYVKQHADEDRRSATLLLDLAPRLCVGEPSRRLLLLRLAALLGGLALAQLDGVAVLAPGAGAQRIATFAGAGDLANLLTHLRNLPVVPVAQTHGFELGEVPLRGSTLHWLSDFANVEPIDLALAALRKRGTQVCGWLPELPLDQHFPGHGYLEIASPDDGSSLRAVVDRGLAAAIDAELLQLRLAQARSFARAGHRLVRVPAPRHAQPDLVDYAVVLAELQGARA